MAHYQLNKEHIANEALQTLKSSNQIDVMKMKIFVFKVRVPTQKYKSSNSEINTRKNNLIKSFNT
jgi:hypothetical protein